MIEDLLGRDQTGEARAQDVAEKLAAAQSHSAHRVVAFEPLAPAALFVRIALTFAAIRVSHAWAVQRTWCVNCLRKWPLSRWRQLRCKPLPLSGGRWCRLLTDSKTAQVLDLPLRSKQ